MSSIWKCVFSVILFSVCVGGCPPAETILPCRCLLRGDDYQIWCSHSDLPRVLEGLRAVGQYVTKPIDELILENNYLPSFPGRTFFPLKVLRLMLRYNGLERVSSDWLAGLETSLMELFIVEPELRSIPDDSLLQLNSLEAITLQTNLMKRLPLFSGLPKLRYLQLESLSLLELSPRNFKNNPSLQKLHISSSPRLNRLEANLLRDLPVLTVVNISYCGISWMHPRAITRLPALKELSFIGNKIVDAGMIGRASRDLPVLEIIRLDNNYIEKLNEAAFVDLPELKKLYLSNNRITELHHGAFHRVPQLRSLDLNKNMLRRVHPESFLQHSGSGLEELWLIENDISHVAELRSLLDALPRLTFLDMSYNNLEAIPFGALRGHATLEHLHLDYNKIHLIDREAFMAMPALRELRLKNNSLSDSLEGPLWNLPALKGLDLSGNYFRRLNPEFFVNVPSLRRIDLSENQLNIINPEVFLNTPALEHINLSVNALNTLHPATFRHLLNLYELDVSYNHLIEFVPGLPRGIEYLHMSHNEIPNIPLPPSPDLDLPSLRMLDLSSNRIQKIPVGSLRSLPQLRRFYLGTNLLQQLDENSLEGLNRLETLDLQTNRIYQIHPNALKEISELRDINLKNNRLDIMIPDVFKNAPRLKKLDVSQNQLAEILPGTLDSNKEIQLIDASNNVLVQLSPTFFGMKNLRYLDLTNNRIKNIDPQILSSMESLRELRMSKNFLHELKEGMLNNLHHLKVLHLDNNEVEIIEPNAIRNLPVLKSIKLSQNKLREIPNSAFNNLPSLQMLELQENRIQILSPNAFNIVPYLLMLNLSYNEIGDIESAGLRSLRSLEMLDLSNNRISKLTSPSLERMEWLVELKMDDNIICGVQGSPFNSMPRLRVLSLRNNRMMSFPEQAIYKLRGNIAVLDIDGNPLACSCSLLWLQAWLQESSMQGPRCVDGTLLREMRLSRQECPLSEEKSINDFAAPGCEAELLSAPELYGTSQVFSQWMKLKSNVTNTNKNKNTIPPSPEESDYFYDEYVDYPYNESIINEQNIVNFKDKNADLTIVKLPPISTTNKSPHLTPGDTPTIYAATKNKTKPDIPKEVVNSPSTSGFTFFGVPLPSINFNKLLGTGRMNDKTPTKMPVTTTVIAERKNAIVNKPTRNNGRRNMQPTNLPPSNMFPPNMISQNMHPPNMPEVQTGGFIPVLPGSGGFKPIIPPHLLIRNETVAAVDRVLESTTTLPEVPTTTSKPTLIRKEHPTAPPPISVTTKEVLSIQESSQLQAKLQIAPEENKDQIYDDIITTENYVDPDEFTTILPTIEEEPPFKISTEAVLSVIESTLSPALEDLQISTAEANTLVENWSSLQDNKTANLNNKSATPLSALLVPGGQQPQFRPAGRSTITKVNSPHAGANSPLLPSNVENSHVSEPLTNSRETSRSKETTTERFNSINDDTNWYFANYNKTNLKPYIGKSSGNGVRGRHVNNLLQVIILLKLLV